MDELISRVTRRQRYLLLAAVILAVIGIGVIVASRIELTTPIRTTTSDGRELIITEITLGTPITRQGQPIAREPRLQQADHYKTTDVLALRLTTSPEVDFDYTVSVRLLTERGEVVELDPSHVPFAPGTSTYCCWAAPPAGEYTFQIFRPERIVTSIPLEIRPDRSASPTPPAP